MFSVGDISCGGLCGRKFGPGLLEPALALMEFLRRGLGRCVVPGARLHEVLELAGDIDRQDQLLGVPPSIDPKPTEQHLHLGGLLLLRLPPARQILVRTVLAQGAVVEAGPELLKPRKQGVIRPVG